ncbi:MAG TPA: MmcQ/YjbR family DNA-binding protein [Bacteroidia bacterium]|nr:MmcQ/YjbR family DNA-binding protein [Bacteroidia bacterium]
MNIESLREYCIAKKGVTESFPFDSDTLVFKVMGKMFCLISVSEPDWFNVKCDPEKAIELREQYPCVQPGYHMSKKMWNSVLIDGTVGDDLLEEWIDHSYDQVVAGLPRKVRAAM